LPPEEGIDRKHRARNTDPVASGSGGLSAPPCAPSGPEAWTRGGGCL